MASTTEKKSDPIELQISIQINKPARTTVTKELLERVIRRWAATSETPNNMEISAIRWRHPKRAEPWQLARGEHVIENARSRLQYIILATKRIEITTGESG